MRFPARRFVSDTEKHKRIGGCNYQLRKKEERQKIMGKNEYQRQIARVLGTRPIAYNSDLAHALGSVKAGLFLSQLLFWWGKGRDPNWIYKTIEEIKEETALSRKEQETAVKICKRLGLIQMKIKGIPGKRHFQININVIVEFLQDYRREHPPP